MAFMQTYVVYFFKAAWPELVQMSGIFSMLSMIPLFLLIPFATKLVAKFGKKEASTWPNILGVISGLLLVLVPMETMGTAGIILFVISSVLIGLAISINSLVGWAMVADCIDSQEIKTGVREEGVVYATYSLGRKLAQGLGSALVSAFLIVAAYNTEFGDAGLPQEDGVALKIRIILGVVYMVCFVAQFALLHWVYDLDKKTVEEMEAKLGRTNEVDINQHLDAMND
jgi:GPH family glycoside/pentoside/hexuronide:cation symporter